MIKNIHIDQESSKLVSQCKSLWVEEINLEVQIGIKHLALYKWMTESSLYNLTFQVLEGWRNTLVQILPHFPPEDKCRSPEKIFSLPVGMSCPNLIIDKVLNMSISKLLLKYLQKLLISPSGLLDSRKTQGSWSCYHFLIAHCMCNST